MANMDKEKFEITHKTAKQIKHYRIIGGLSQESLAIAAGLNPAFLGHIERCLKCPTIDTLNKIATALNISLSQLLDFDNETIVNENERTMKKLNQLICNLSPQESEEIAEIVAKIIKFKHEK